MLVRTQIALFAQADWAQPIIAMFTCLRFNPSDDTFPAGARFTSRVRERAASIVSPKRDLVPPDHAETPQAPVLPNGS